MNAEQFCHWLQGRAELMPDHPPSKDEWKMISEHLAAALKRAAPAKIGVQPKYTQAIPSDFGRQQALPSQPFDPNRIYC